MPGSAAVRPSYMCRSEPQMQLEVILTITSFGCFYLGIGNFLYGNAERTLVYDGSHDDLLFALLDC